MKKKTQGDLLAPCIYCCKFKDKRGTLQKRFLQDNNDKRGCALPSSEYQLVLCLQEKEEEEGGYDALPLL
jgi:hypothetical protein